MSTEDSTYAPRSPDLSFLSGSDLPSNSAELPQIPPPTSLYYQKATDRVLPLAPGAIQSQPHHPSQLGYQPQSTDVLQSKPTSTPAGPGQVFINNHNHNHNHNNHQQFAQYPNQQYPFHQQLIPQPHAPSYSPQPQSPTLSTYGTLQASSTPRSYYPPYSAPTSGATHYPTSQPQSASSPYNQPTSRDPYYQAQPSASDHPVPQSQGAQGPYFVATQDNLLYGQQFLVPDHPTAMPPRKAAQVAAKQPEIMQSPVRTKFPTARIKRIMQADEEVGKVAQQTPIAVGKALELFMVQLVSKSAEVAKEKNSKRITAQMLKQAVESANEWDFLQEIVAKVSEKEETSRGAAGKTRQESDSDEEADAGEVKKRGRGGRKKKAPA